MELKLSNNESGGKTQNVLKGEVRVGMVIWRP